MKKYLSWLGIVLITLFVESMASSVIGNKLVVIEEESQSFEIAFSAPYPEEKYDFPIKARMIITVGEPQERQEIAREKLLSFFREKKRVVRLQTVYHGSYLVGAEIYYASE